MKTAIHHMLLTALCGVLPAVVFAMGAEPTKAPATFNGSSIMEAQVLKSIVKNHRTLLLSKEGIQIAWHPSSKRLAVIDSDGGLIEFDADTGDQVRALPRSTHGKLLGGLAYTSDGKYLLGGKGGITVYDAATGKLIKEILGPYENDPRGAQGIDALAVSPDSKTVVVRYQQYRNHPTNENLSAFDIASGRKVFSLNIESTHERAKQATGNLTYSQDGQFLLLGRVERWTNPHLKQYGGKHENFVNLDFLNPAAGVAIKTIPSVHVMGITALAISRDGRYVATGTDTLAKDSQLNETTGDWDYIHNQDPIRLWDVASGKLVKEFGPLRGAVRGLSFNPEGSVLASCQTDLTSKETIWLWDVASGRLIERVRTSNSASEMFDCAFSPDGRYLAMPMIDQIHLIELRR